VQLSLPPFAHHESHAPLLQKEKLCQGCLTSLWAMMRHYGGEPWATGCWIDPPTILCATLQRLLSPPTRPSACNRLDYMRTGILASEQPASSNSLLVAIEGGIAVRPHDKRMECFAWVAIGSTRFPGGVLL
jgi:hypothetical protein